MISPEPDKPRRTGSTRSNKAPEAVWCEYPLGWWGQLTTAVTRVLLAFLVGVGATAATVIAFGLVGEEGVLPSRELTRATDMFTRFSIVPLAGFALGGWLVLALAQIGKQVAVSRALVRAVDKGASPAAVPHPGQLELATTPVGSYFMTLVLAHAAVLGLFLLIGGAVILFDPFDDAWIMLAVPAGWLGLLGVSCLALTGWIRPTQARRERVILGHWRSDQRFLARSKARVQAQPERTATDAFRTAADGLLGVTGALAGIAIVLLHGLLFVTHPNAQRWPGGRAGERATLAPEAESLVDQLVVAFTALVVSAVLAAAAASVLTVVASRREQRVLRMALEDEEAERPPESLLSRHGQSRVPPSAQLLAALSGLALCLGVTGLALGTPGPADFASVYRGSEELFGALRHVFEATLGAGCVLLAAALGVTSLANVRGRRLRNALHARWPALPST